MDWNIFTRAHKYAALRPGKPNTVLQVEGVFERGPRIVAQVYAVEDEPGLQIESDTLDLDHPYKTESGGLVYRLLEEATASPFREPRVDTPADQTDGQHRGNVIDLFDPNWDDPTQRYEAMLKMEGRSLRWALDSQDPRPGTTISIDALTVLEAHIRGWIGSRLSRRIGEGKSAKRPRVTVTVDFE